jgi:L-lactate permease
VAFGAIGTPILTLAGVTRLPVDTLSAMGRPPAALLCGAGALLAHLQSIVVAGAATGQQGDEGELLRYGFWHSVALGCLMGVLVFLQSNLLSWMIPG